jgi:hypothetical protein
MPNNVQSWPGLLKRRKSKVIVYVENNKPYNQRTIGKVKLQQPIIFFLLREWQSSVAESSCNTTRAEVLLTNKDASAVKFRDQIRTYNSMLAFTSLGAKVDELVTRGTGPYSFRIQGELYHKIRSLCLVEGQRPQFAQLYIHDTKCEHQNRHAIMPSLDPTTLNRFLTMMYNINPYVEVFKMARDMMATEGAPMDLKLHLIASRTKDARRYNVLTADEVAALMVGDGSEAVDKRDVVLAQQTSPF